MRKHKIQVLFISYKQAIVLVTPLCWFCNPEKIHLKSQSIEYIYPSDIYEKRKTENFADPLNSLVGFVIKYEVVLSIIK